MCACGVHPLHALMTMVSKIVNFGDCVTLGDYLVFFFLFFNHPQTGTPVAKIKVAVLLRAAASP